MTNFGAFARSKTRPQISSKTSLTFSLHFFDIILTENDLSQHKQTN